MGEPEAQGYVLRNRAGEIIQCGGMKPERTGEDWWEWHPVPPVTLRDGDTLSMRWGCTWPPAEEWE